MRRVQLVVQKPPRVEPAPFHDPFRGTLDREHGEESEKLGGRFQRSHVRRLLLGQIPGNSQSRVRAIVASASVR